MEKPLYARLVWFGLALALVIFALRRQTKLYRQARRFGFDTAKAKLHGVTIDRAKAKGQWIAVSQLGIPGFGIYLAGMLVLAFNYSLATLLLIGAGIYVLYVPARRILGFVPACTIAQLKNDYTVPRPRLRDCAGAYFREVRRSERRYSQTFPALIRWTAPVIGYVCLWPFVMIPSTLMYIKRVQSEDYALPHWRDYSKTPPA